ncbi:MAG TPA: histidine kinase [Allosphingosinicella sp.]|jgi:signal transduction histidine kinase
MLKTGRGVAGGAGSGRVGAGELRTVLVLIAAYWAMFQLIFFAYLALSGVRRPVTGRDNLLLEALRYAVKPEELVIVALGSLLCFLIYAGLKRTRHLYFWLQLPLAVLTSVAAAVLFSGIVLGTLDMFGIPQPPVTPRRFAADVMIWIAPLGLWTAITLALAYNQQVRENEQRLSLLRLEAEQAHVRALRYQVNPHFLYNTLNSISALILDGRNEAADAMVIRLSSFFRASLSHDPTGDVPLADEIDLQKLYLDIELLRFEDALSVRIDVPPELESALVPNLILQPLVENALKHGVNDHGRETVLTVRAREREGRLLVEVADNGPGKRRAGGSGIGLNNVARRLSSRFGSTARLDACSTPGEGFKVTLTMPLEYA